MSRVINPCGLLALTASMTLGSALASDTVAPLASSVGDPIDIPTFMAIPRPVPTTEIRYGAEPAQAIDVFLPAGSGPSPVVVLIHGGCWSAKTAGRQQLRHVGSDLADRGMAVWSIGYRRSDEAGGGYPGTYQDIATAIDRLRDDAHRYGLDLSRTVFVGHSAGGHLALWAAGRDRLPINSPLRASAPMLPREVIALAGVGDLKAFSPLVPGICGPGIVENLVGAPTAERPDVYAETSPSVLGATDARVVMVSGVLDRLVPPYVAHDYARAVRGEVAVELVNIEGAGHFDLVATGDAWEAVRANIEAALAQ